MKKRNFAIAKLCT